MNDARIDERRGLRWHKADSQFGTEASTVGFGFPRGSVTD